MTKSRLAIAVCVAALFSTGAMAVPSNESPPAGNVILNLSGTPTFATAHQYGVSFVATQSITNLSFAFREDPAFLFLDNVVLTQGAGPNLVINGDFELGPVGLNQPTGWTYLNIFGAAAAGVVADSGTCGTRGVSGNCYYDGAVQAYDSITQAIATTIGLTYDLTFFLADNSNATTYSALSTNGNTTGTGGNGINLVVYAGALPTPAAVPEPVTLSLFGAGLVGAAALRRRRSSKKA